MSHSDVSSRSTAAAAVTDFDADVPQRCQQSLDGGRRDDVGVLRQQDQQVDVRMREQLAASVPADRDERRRGGHVRFAPYVADDFVRQPGEAAQQPWSIGVLEELPPQRVASRVKLLAPMRDAWLAWRCRRYVVRRCDVHRRAFWGVGSPVPSVAPDRLQSDAVGGGGGVPADCVMIS